jgi:hypothetical protein
MSMSDQPGFFDVDERHAALSTAGDPLERRSAVATLIFYAQCWMRR